MAGHPEHKQIIPLLQEFADRGAHFVLARADKRPISAQWQKTPAAIADVKAHAESGLVGIIPASIGCFVVDIDEGGLAGEAAVCEALGNPIAVIASARAGGYHVWYRAIAGGDIGNRKWALEGGAGDIRGNAGFVILWQALTLAGMLKARFDDATPVDPNTGQLPKPARDRARGPQAVRNAPEGDRNNVLNLEAFHAAKRGETNLAPYREAAREAGLPASEIGATLAGAALAGAAQPDGDFERAVTRLAAMRRHEYDGVRKDESNRLNVRIGTLDGAVKAARPENGDGDGMQGRALEFPKPDPWPDPVDGAALLESLSAMIGRYVSMPPALADAVALWAVSTWLHDRLEISTFLNVTSATKRCGKSLLLEVLAELTYRTLPVSGRITPAALFRTIEKHAPTLLLDEADTYFMEDPDLRGVINGSHRRKLAHVIRCDGDDNEPRQFTTWCPKAIAGIGGLPDTVLDRSLVVRLERRLEGGLEGRAPAVVSLWRDREHEAVAILQCQIARWVDDNADVILANRRLVAFPGGLHERARDAWEVLLAAGEAAGEGWAGPGGRARRSCEHVNADAEDETGGREKLLADLRETFICARDPSAMRTTTILDSLHAMEGRPWSEWKRGKPLSSRGLSDLLRPFKVYPATIRFDAVLAKGYKREDLERVWNTYLPGGAGVPLT